MKILMWKMVEIKCNLAKLHFGIKLENDIKKIEKECNEKITKTLTHIVHLAIVIFTKI